MVNWRYQGNALIEDCGGGLVPIDVLLRSVTWNLIEITKAIQQREGQTGFRFSKKAWDAFAE